MGGVNQLLQVYHEKVDCLTSVCNWMDLQSIYHRCKHMDPQRCLLNLWRRHLSWDFLGGNSRFRIRKAKCRCDYCPEGDTLGCRSRYGFSPPPAAVSCVGDIRRDGWGSPDTRSPLNHQCIHPVFEKHIFLIFCLKHLRPFWFRVDQWGGVNSFKRKLSLAAHLDPQFWNIIFKLTHLCHLSTAFPVFINWFLWKNNFTYGCLCIRIKDLFPSLKLLLSPSWELCGYWLGLGLDQTSLLGILVHMRPANVAIHLLRLFY